MPAPFREDVYALTPETRACFPRYRYMVIGGPRSGSNMHVDPRWTAAWNTLLVRALDFTQGTQGLTGSISRRTLGS